MNILGLTSNFNGFPFVSEVNGVEDALYPNLKDFKMSIFWYLFYLKTGQTKEYVLS